MDFLNLFHYEKCQKKIIFIFNTKLLEFLLEQDTYLTTDCRVSNKYWNIVSSRRKQWNLESFRKNMIINDLLIILNNKKGHLPSRMLNQP